MTLYILNFIKIFVIRLYIVNINCYFNNTQVIKSKTELFKIEYILSINRILLWMHFCFPNFGHRIQGLMHVFLNTTG